MNLTRAVRTAWLVSTAAVASIRASRAYWRELRRLTGQRVTELEFASVDDLVRTHHAAVAAAVDGAGRFATEAVGDFQITPDTFADELRMLMELHAFDGSAQEFWKQRPYPGLL